MYYTHNQVVPDKCWESVGIPRPDAGPSHCHTCVYVYSSQPQPLQPAYGRPKYRNNASKPGYYNLMWDPRVCRGKPEKQPEKNFIQCFNVRKPKKVVRKPKFIYKREAPPSPKWRSNYEGIPDNNYEELTPNLIEDEHAVVSLDETLDLSSCPATCPSVGIDISTEILPGDIFDFDIQQLPIVEALVGSVCERAIHELLEEEELKALRDQQAQFEALRKKEQLKLLELKEQHDRLEAERVRVAAEAADYIAFNKAVTNRIGAVAFSNLYLGDPLTDILDGLKNRDDGPKTQALISNVFIPCLNADVEIEVKNLENCRSLLDDIILTTVTKREDDFFLGKWNKEQEELQRLAMIKAMQHMEEEYGEDG